MRRKQYFVVLLLAIACVILTVALVVLGQTNQKLQVQLQAREQTLSQGILGQQAQQISGGVVKDLAAAASGNSEIRQLLTKHGYNVPSGRPRSSEMGIPHRIAGGSSRTPDSARNSPQE